MHCQMDENEEWNWKYCNRRMVIYAFGLVHALCLVGLWLQRPKNHMIILIKQKRYFLLGVLFRLTNTVIDSASTTAIASFVH